MASLEKDKNETNPNQEGTAPADLSKTEGVSIDRFDEQLRNGVIPEEFREELKLVDEHSPEGEMFNEILTNLVTELYSVAGKRIDISLTNSLDREILEFINHDFEANPVRFYLSDDTSENACYISKSRPACIVINKGLFLNLRNSRDGAAVQNLSELISVVCHEITHYKLELKYGEDHQNSKEEETLAYTVPLLQLFMNGYNPSEAMGTLERTNKNYATTNKDILSRLADVHPDGNTIREICTTYIASLTQNYGSLEATNPASENNQNYKALSDIITSPKTKHISAFEKLTNSYLTEGSSTKDKIEAINIFLSNLDDSQLYPVRIRSCIDYFRKLQIDRESKEIKKAVSTLADTILQKIESSNVLLLNSLYKICCISLSKNEQTPLPLGRLKNLRKLNKIFIESIIELSSVKEIKDEKKRNEEIMKKIIEIKDAAKNLVDEYKKKEDLCQRKSSFLRGFNWGRFSEDELSDATEYFKEYLLDNLDDYLIEAAFLNNFHKDTDIMYALVQNSDLFLKYYKQDFSTIFSTLSRRDRRNLDKIITYSVKSIIYEFAKDPSRHEEILKLLDTIKTNEDELRGNESTEFMKMHPKLFFEVHNSYYSLPQNLTVLLNDIHKMRKTDRESYIKIVRALYDLDNQIEEAKPIGTFYHKDLSTNEKILFYDFFNNINDEKLISERDKQTILIKILTYDLIICPDFEDKKLIDYFFKSASSLLGKTREELEQYNYSEISNICKDTSFDSFTNSEKEFLQYFSYILFLQRYESGESIPLGDLVNFPFKEIFSRRNDEGLQFVQKSSKFIDKEFLKKYKRRKIETLCSDFISLNNTGLVSEELKEKVGEYIISKLESASANEEYERVMQICKNLLKSKTFDSIRIKNQIIGIFVDAFIGKYGTDHGSIEYADKVKEFIISELQQERISSRDRYQLYESLASNIEAQKNLSFFFEDQLKIINEENFSASNSFGSICDYIYRVIKKDRQSDRRLAIINFLQSKGENEDIESLLNNFDEYFSSDITYNPDLIGGNFLRQRAFKEISLLHENFHEFSLQEKAVFIKALLSDSEGNIPNDIFNTMLDNIFSPDIPYAQECKDLLKTHVSCFQKEYRDLLLSALLTAQNSKDKSFHSAGELFTLIAENLGPAYMKVMQAIEGNTAIPKDLRDDISRHARRLKFDGARPTRWELWHCLENIDPNALDQFSHIGDIIGNASMNIAVDITLNNGEHRILSLLRPNAQRKAEYGFEMMLQTAKDKKYSDNVYSEIIQDLVESASSRIKIEVDCELASEQYDKAFNMYNNKIISLNGRRFVFTAAQVQEAGRNYYTMNKIEGQHFTELPEDSDEQFQFKKECAKAILTLELSHILSGQFDADRHGGQMKIVQNGSDVFIGHFDFKGMRIGDWQESDYQQLANILCATVLQNLGTQNDDSTAKTSQSFSTQSFIEAENEILKQGEQISPLISEVRKALLSLNEYFNLLDKKEIAEVALSALLSGRLSPALVNSIVDNIVPILYFSEKFKPLISFFGEGEESINKIKEMVTILIQGNLPQNEIKGVLGLPEDFELIKIK